MKKLLLMTGAVLTLGVPLLFGSDTLFTTPVIYVRPQTLNFGLVASKAIATNTFVVENMGRGKLVGKATVPAPFKIISGGTYTLQENEAQIVTVTYTPTGAAVDTQTVKFTGGGGSQVRVTGKLLNPAARQSKRS
jgi:hypothetical protein